MFEDAVSEDLIEDAVQADCSNDTKEDDLHYFACLTNHYLSLVKSNPSSSVTSMKYPVIADSGANFHIFKEREFSTKIIPANGSVLLGDGQTALPILGIGTVRCKIENHILEIENVRYVPSLAESIYSLFVHIQHSGHGLHSSCDTGLLIKIKFPDFQMRAIIGNHDIYINVVPVLDGDYLGQSMIPDEFYTAANVETSLCRNIPQFQEELSKETDHIDNLLCHLSRYYNEIKTKCQLGLNVPAGFRSLPQWQKEFKSFNPSRRSKSLNDFSITDELPNVDNLIDLLSPTEPDNQTSSIPSTASMDFATSSIVSSVHVPIIRSVVKIRLLLLRQSRYLKTSSELVSASVKLIH